MFLIILNELNFEKSENSRRVSNISMCYVSIFSLKSKSSSVISEILSSIFQLNFQNQSCQNLYQSHLGVAFFSLYFQF